MAHVSDQSRKKKHGEEKKKKAGDLLKSLTIDEQTADIVMFESGDGPVGPGGTVRESDEIDSRGGGKRADTYKRTISWVTVSTQI